MIKISYKIRYWETSIDQDTYNQFLDQQPDPLDDDQLNYFDTWDNNRGISSLMEYSFQLNKVKPSEKVYSGDDCLGLRNTAIKEWLRLLIQKRKQENFINPKNLPEALKKTKDIVKAYSVDFLMIYNDKEYFLHSYYKDFYCVVANLEMEYNLFKSEGIRFPNIKSYAGQDFKLKEVQIQSGPFVRRELHEKRFPIYVVPSSKLITEKYLRSVDSNWIGDNFNDVQG